MKQDSFSAINEKAALRDKGGVVMEKQSELQQAGRVHYEQHTHKEAFFNRCTKENTGLDIKSEVAEGPIADELAMFKQMY